MLSLLHLRVKAQQYFVSLSYIFLDKKNVPKIWLNLGLDLTIFQGTGPTAGTWGLQITDPVFKLLDHAASLVTPYLLKAQSEEPIIPMQGRSQPIDL